MGPVRGNAALWGLMLLGLLLLIASSALAQETSDAEQEGEVKQEAPEEWTENLFSFEPVRIDSSVLEHQIEIIVHRWGSFTKTQSFKLALEEKPTFMKKAWWAEGETVEFSPEETEKVVNLRFTLVEAGKASGDLVFSIMTEDEEISPRARRFELPFGFGREEGEGCAYLLKEDAPETIDPNELHEWVDPEIEPVYSCDDRVAVFFTPAIDLEADKVSFRWEVQPPEPNRGDSEEQEKERIPVVDFGFYAPPDGLLHRELGINPFPNIPGKFIVELPRQNSSRWHWDSYAGWASGLFRVVTAVERESGSSLFGIQGSVAVEYVEVATFKFTPLPELQFTGLRTDPPRNANLEKLPWCYDGTLHMSATASGRMLHLDMEASYRRLSVDDETTPEKDRHKASFKAKVELPETLKLGQHVMGEGKITCEEFSQGALYSRGDVMVRAFAGIADLVAVNNRQPDRWLLFDEELRSMASVYIPDGPDAPMFDGCPFNDSKVLEERIPEWETWIYQVTSRSIDETGSPKRKLGFHLRDSATVFILPIRFSFPTHTDESETYEVFSYAIYKVKGS